eukprot:SAG31_NODE_19421_length_602_cov_1.850895_1_plen_43_part_01
MYRSLLDYYYGTVWRQPGTRYLVYFEYYVLFISLIILIIYLYG